MEIHAAFDGNLDVQMRSLRERMKELRASHEAQIGFVLEKYQDLVRQIDIYHHNLEAVMTTEPITAKAIILQ